MRDTRFRGKAQNDGRWKYGNYCIRHGHHCIQSGDVWTFVDPRTLGEFIGTQDKNGIDIYTGDIVNTWNEAWFWNYEIAWDPRELQFWKKTGAETYASIAWWLDNPYHQLLIVGNIFDNPERLS